MSAEALAETLVLMPALTLAAFAIHSATLPDWVRRALLALAIVACLAALLHRAMAPDEALRPDQDVEFRGLDHPGSSIAAPAAEPR